MSRALCHLAFRSVRRLAGHIRLDLAAAVVVVLAAFPVSASAALKGIDTDLDWGTNSTTQTQTANVVQDSGATWTRLTISWADAEPQAGKYSSSYLSALDNAVSLMQARGVHIEVFVYESPQWETGNANVETPPANDADFASFLSAMVSRYKGKVAAWEIWNEENSPLFWSTGPNAGQYAALLKAAYPAVKSVDPNALVVFGGMAYNDYNFLDAAYQAAPDLGNYYDVMATHPYTLNNAPPDLTLRDANGAIDARSFNAYRLVHQVMLNHGDVKPIWFTEFGWSTWSGGVSQAQQAAYLTLAYQCIEQDSYVQVANWYNLRNNYWANDANTWDDQLGLLNTDFSPKLAYAAYKAYAPGNTGCVYHEQDGTPTPADGSLPLTVGTTSGGGTTTTGINSTGTSSAGGTTTTARQVTPAARQVTPTARQVTPTQTTLRSIGAVLARAASAAFRVIGSRVTLVGNVTGAQSGSVTVLLEAAGRGMAWHRIARLTTKLSSDDSFKVKLGCRIHVPMLGRTLVRLRARAIYSGAPGYAPSRSRVVYLWAKRTAGGCSQIMSS